MVPKMHDIWPKICVLQKQCVFWLFMEQVNILKESGQICFVFLTNLLKESRQKKWFAIHFACAEDYLTWEWWWWFYDQWPIFEQCVNSLASAMAMKTSISWTFCIFSSSISPEASRMRCSHFYSSQMRQTPPWMPPPKVFPFKPSNIWSEKIQK